MTVMKRNEWVVSESERMNVRCSGLESDVVVVEAEAGLRDRDSDSVGELTESRCTEVEMGGSENARGTRTGWM